MAKKSQQRSTLAKWTIPAAPTALITYAALQLNAIPAALTAFGPAVAIAATGAAIYALIRVALAVTDRYVYGSGNKAKPTQNPIRQATNSIQQRRPTLTKAQRKENLKNSQKQKATKNLINLLAQPQARQQFGRLNESNAADYADTAIRNLEQGGLRFPGLSSKELKSHITAVLPRAMTAALSRMAPIEAETKMPASSPPMPQRAEVSVLPELGTDPAPLNADERQMLKQHAASKIFTDPTVRSYAEQYNSHETAIMIATDLNAQIQSANPLVADIASLTTRSQAVEVIMEGVQSALADYYQHDYSTLVRPVSGEPSTGLNQEPQQNTPRASGP